MNKKIFAMIFAVVMVFTSCGELPRKSTSEIPSKTVDVPTKNSSVAVEPVSTIESETISDTISDTNSDISSDTISDTDSTTDSEKTEESEKLAPTDIELGENTISAEELIFDNGIKVKDTAHSDAFVYGDELYILDGKKLRSFTFADKINENTDNTVELSGLYEHADIDSYGTIYISRNKFDGIVIDESGDMATEKTSGIISMSKMMNYGLCVNDGKITKFFDADKNAWTAIEDKNNYPENITALEFSKNHVVVAYTKDGVRKVDVLDVDGTVFSSTSGDEADEDLTAVTELNGIIVASCCGDIILWNDSGEVIGRLSSNDTAKLFGVENPVYIKKFISEDNSVLAFCIADDKPRLFRFRMS